MQNLQVEAPSFGRCYEPTRQLGRAKHNASQHEKLVCVAKMVARTQLKWSMSKITDSRYPVSSIRRSHRYQRMWRRHQNKSASASFPSCLSWEQESSTCGNVFKTYEPRNGLFLLRAGMRKKCPNNEKHLCTSFHGSHSLQSTVSRTFSVSASKGSSRSRETSKAREPPQCTKQIRLKHTTSKIPVSTKIKSHLHTWQFSGIAFWKLYLGEKKRPKVLVSCQFERTHFGHLQLQIELEIFRRLWWSFPLRETLSVPQHWRV